MDNQSVIVHTDATGMSHVQTRVVSGAVVARIVEVGVGRVAEVCEFANGWAVVSWPGDQSGVANVIVYADIEHVERIHGHNGRTRLVPRS